MNKGNSERLIDRWFAFKNWTVFPFQNECWNLSKEGKSGLIAVPTGAGKTYAAYLPALHRLHANPHRGMQILYITPLKALAKDLEFALKKPIEDLNLPYRVEKRTGDTTATAKNKQKKSPPDILLTTPESLALLLTDPEAALRFSHLQTIIVDEWHELLSSKRGVLLELCLSRLKTYAPQVLIWGLTATIGNIQEAAQVCVGADRIPSLITSTIPREVIISQILPDSIDKLPWAGFLGIKMLRYVLNELDPAHPTLIFTNTRSQAEKWFQAILDQNPQWEELMGLHHSSIDKKSRESIEEGIKSGRLKFVICTSSLDLGIDLPSVEKVIQIGSPKSLARLIQRAGRSFHKPLTPCNISLVPTHALEVVELKAFRLGLKDHLIEKRIPLKKCYDVLMQHMTTCAIGGGFEKMQLFNEIKTTCCFADLTHTEYENCLQFLTTGGKALQGYAEYRKLVEKNERYEVEDSLIIRRHKMNIGTITSDPYVAVKLMRGKTIGMVEESFLSHLKKDDTFVFAGRKLKLVQYRDMVAYVRLTTTDQGITAVWKGSRLPFSPPLGEMLRKAFVHSHEENLESALLKDILKLQSKISYLPHENELLIEILKTREGWHLFVYPFEGKTIHEGLSLLIAHRLSKLTASTFTISCNDYGFVLQSSKPFALEALTPTLFSPEAHATEIEELMNIHEASKGCFRDIARIGGLVFQGYPRKQKSHRQVQISTSLLFDVLQKYDPENVLLSQARNEVLERQFESVRVHEVLKRLSESTFVIKTLRQFSPFALPLFIERVSERLSTESLAERVKNIQESWIK